VRTPLRALSGGERGRLMLARALAKPSNLLVLDEPTNDLDLETLDVLEEMIGDYSGTVLLISHDRDFLDRSVNAVLAPEGNGKWVEYAGGYSDMLAQRGDDLRKPAVKPAPAPAKPKAVRPGAEAPKRKLNFNEKHALEMLPDRMAALEAEVRRLQDKLADRELYVRNRATFDKASTALAAAQAELSAAEERWLELELLRTQIEGP
jgi:ATP-binding cassette subfamily F protein uup